MHTNLSAQAELGFSDTLHCSNDTYCVDLEIKATAGNSFDIGTSSFLVTYDANVLEFASYSPLGFDALTTTCSGVWALQKTDIFEADGKFGLTIRLLNNTGGCTTIGTTPMVIGTLCFDVKTQGAIPNITFENVNTRINNKTPDNGTMPIVIASIDTLNMPNFLACDCSGLGDPCDDLNVFTINDQYDIHCNCAGALIDVDVDGIYDGVDNCLDVFYEVEDGNFVGAVFKNNEPQYNGTGFVDYKNKSGDTLSFPIIIDSLSAYDLIIRYANGDVSNRRLKLFIDSTLISDTLTFPPTGGWGNWGEIQLTDTMTADTHMVYFVSHGSVHGPNLDRIAVSSCGTCSMAGTSCDDGDPCTNSDTYDTACNCKGVYSDADNDGVCDNQDICPEGDDNVDSDMDGIPDACDDCDNTLIGTACDDGDPCTINDVFDSNCNCVGTFNGNDSDGDGVCDSIDACPGFDDNLDIDGDGTPDDCDTCNDLTVGLPCDDGNPCTILDVVTPGCGCGGIPIYLELNHNIDTISCHGELASIDLTPEHMVGGVYYQWNTGTFTEDLMGLSPGIYSVTATDWRNCSVSDTFEITEPSPLDLNYSIVPSGGSNGSIDLTVSGGTPPYAYLWATGDTIEDLTALESDRFHVIVTDSLACSVAGFADVEIDSMCVDTILQYEYGEYINLKTLNTDFGPAMDGYIRFGHDDSHSSVTHYIDFPEYGNYEFNIRHAEATKDRPVNIYLDGVLKHSALFIPKTGNDSVFHRVSFMIDSIPPGIHTIMTERATTQNNYPRLDYLAVCKTTSLPCSDLTGNACSDGDLCTVNDTLDAFCNCIGTYMDSDNDGVCDAEDLCPASDDTIDSDGDGIPDACDACFAVKYEAEDAEKISINTKNQGSGWTGTGYVDYNSSTGDTLRFSIDAQNAGNYNISLRYSVNASDRYLDVFVNENLVIDTLFFPNTGSGNTNWTDLAFQLELCEGTNILELITDGHHGPNIDFAQICLPNTSIEPVIAKGNENFEDGLNNWTELSFSGNNSLQIDESTTDVFCGQKSVHYAGSSGLEKFYTDIDFLSIDSVYTLHFYAAGDSAVGIIGLPDQIYNGQYFSIDATSGNGDFVHQSLTFTASAPTMRLWFEFYPLTTMTLDAFSFNGMHLDSDNDQICDEFDICPGHDDRTDLDEDGIPYGCDTCFDLIYQAEAANFSGAIPSNSVDAFLGAGYLLSNTLNDTITFLVDAPENGDYNISLRHISTDTLRKVDVFIDNSLAINDLVFLKTCNAWEYLSFTHSLTQGVHEIKLVTDGHLGPKLDFLSICLPGYFPQPVIAQGNGQFEEDFQHWTRLDNWASSSSTLINTDSLTVMCGLQSAHYSGAPNYQQLYADITNLFVDTTYTIHFYAAGGYADCYVGPVSNVYNGSYLFVDATSGNGDFVHHAFTFTATEKTMRIWFDLYPNSALTLDAFSFDNSHCIIDIEPKALLSGAFDSNTNMMYDSLRIKNLIPLIEPYSALSDFTHEARGGGETVDTSVLQVTGNDAIVDWVMLELRDKSDSTNVLATKSALIQKDGDIVGLDGISHVKFRTVFADDYYLSIRHRNHLGIMSAVPISLGNGLVAIDFTNVSTFGTNAQNDLGGGIMGMWAGDGNDDGKIIYQGANSDLMPTSASVYSDAANSTFLASHPVLGYLRSDYNMDGVARYMGADSDKDFIKNIILTHPLNIDGEKGYVIWGQLP